MEKVIGIVSLRKHILGGHDGIMLAPRAKGLWFDPRWTHLNIFSQGYYANHLLHKNSRHNKNVEILINTKWNWHMCTAVTSLIYTWIRHYRMNIIAPFKISFISYISFNSTYKYQRYRIETASMCTFDIQWLKKTFNLKTTYLPTVYFFIKKKLDTCNSFTFHSFLLNEFISHYPIISTVSNNYVNPTHIN